MAGVERGEVTDAAWAAMVVIAALMLWFDLSDTP